MCDARPPLTFGIQSPKFYLFYLKMADQSETSHELTELHILYMHYITELHILYMHYIIWSSLTIYHMEFTH